MYSRTTYRRLAILIPFAPIALLAGPLGCDDASEKKDPLVDVANQYREVVQNRQLNRESPDQVDDTATRLRTLAGRATSAGRGGDGIGAAVLASGIRSSAATFEAQEALRIESKTNRLRSIARQLISDADLLGGSAENAENLDLSDVDLYLESELSGASDRVSRAQEELVKLNRNRDEVISQQQARLDRARSQEAAAVEIARDGVDRGPIDGFDSINESIQYRQVANRERIAAARDEISVQTLAPTIALANTEASGQASVVDSARQARENAQSRRSEAQTFAREVRTELAEMATMVNDLLSEVTTLEDDEVLPRLEAAIEDYKAAANAARPLTRGSKEEKTTGWRTIANAQLGLGRTEWDRVMVLDRRSDLLERLADSDILMDRDGTLENSIEAVQEDRTAAIDAAKSALNDALASLGKISNQDATDARTKKTIQLALQGLDGQSMRPDEPERRRTTRPSRGSRDSGRRSRRGGPGFESPADAAAFLSDPTNQIMPDNLERLEDSILASSRDAKNLEELFTIASFMAPMVEAMEKKFGAAEMQSAMSMDRDLGMLDSGRFAVENAEDDRATLTMGSNQMSLTIVLVKDDGRWFIDLDETIDTDPRISMIAKTMGPMLKERMKPMKAAASEIARNIRAGDYETADEAMAAFEAKMLEETERLMDSGSSGGRSGGLMGN